MLKTFLATGLGCAILTSCGSYVTSSTVDGGYSSEVSPSMPVAAAHVEDREVGTSPGLSETSQQSNAPTDPNAPRKVIFKDIAPIVEKSCVNCHSGSRLFALKTREDFVARKPLPLKAILSGSMPRRNPGWKDTADGKLVIEWLQGDQAE